MIDAVSDAFQCAIRYQTGEVPGALGPANSVAISVSMKPNINAYHVGALTPELNTRSIRHDQRGVF